MWEAVNARSRLGMDLEQRALLPLVGRTRELDALLGASTGRPRRASRSS